MPSLPLLIDTQHWVTRMQTSHDGGESDDKHNHWLRFVYCLIMDPSLHLTTHWSGNRQTKLRKGKFFQSTSVLSQTYKDVKFVTHTTSYMKSILLSIACIAFLWIFAMQWIFILVHCNTVYSVHTNTGVQVFWYSLVCVKYIFMNGLDICSLCCELGDIFHIFVCSCMYALFAREWNLFNKDTMTKHCSIHTNNTYIWAAYFIPFKTLYFYHCLGYLMALCVSMRSCISLHIIVTSSSIYVLTFISLWLQVLATRLLALIKSIRARQIISICCYLLSVSFSWLQ